jgi:hypothetical protein
MPDTRVCDESLVNHMGSLVGRTTSHHALYDGAVCVVCGMRACGSLVGCTTSHHALYDGAAASLVVPRAIIRRTMMRQPRWLYHEPPCVVRWCGVYVFGAAAPLGEGDPLGLPLTPSAGWTLPEGAQVQCPRGVLALRGKRHSKRDTAAARSLRPPPFFIF